MPQESLKAALTKTIGGRREYPATSRVVFRAETDWQQDGSCIARVLKVSINGVVLQMAV